MGPCVCRHCLSGQARSRLGKHIPCHCGPVPFSSSPSLPPGICARVVRPDFSREARNLGFCAQNLGVWVKQGKYDPQANRSCATVFDYSHQIWVSSEKGQDLIICRTMSDKNDIDTWRTSGRCNETRPGKSCGIKKKTLGSSSDDLGLSLGLLLTGWIPWTQHFTFLSISFLSSSTRTVVLLS